MNSKIADKIFDILYEYEQCKNDEFTVDFVSHQLAKYLDNKFSNFLFRQWEVNEEILRVFIKKEVVNTIGQLDKFCDGILYNLWTDGKKFLIILKDIPAEYIKRLNQNFLEQIIWYNDIWWFIDIGDVFEDKEKQKFFLNSCISVYFK